MEWLILWPIMSIIVAMIAHSKGKNAFVWLIYGLIIWPKRSFVASVAATSRRVQYGHPD